jgi:PadR family transcriptional regulator PadR
MFDQITQLEQMIMLAILRKRPNAYGISIQDEIKDRTGADYSVGTLYATLERLKQKGFVSSRQGEATAERGGRRKTYYDLTAAGQATLSGSLNNIKSLTEGIDWPGALA